MRVDPQELGFNQLIKKLYRQELANQTSEQMGFMGKFALDRARASDNPEESLDKVNQDRQKLASAIALENFGILWDADKAESMDNYDSLKEKYSENKGVLQVLDFMEKFEELPRDGFSLLKEHFLG